MSKNKRLQKPIAIAVEVADWFYLLLNQIKNKEEFADIQLFDFGGTSQLGSFLSLLRRDRKFKQLKALGIMRDAELDSEAAIASLQTTLRQAGFAAQTPQIRLAQRPFLPSRIWLFHTMNRQVALKMPSLKRIKTKRSATA